MSPTTGKQPQSGDGAWTPGPWRVEDGTALVWGACNEDDLSSYGMGFPVAEAVGGRSWSKTVRPTQDQRYANAHLIAAAPDLYEAARQAREAFIVAGSMALSDAELLALIDAALAKARGGIPVETAIDYLTRSFAEDEEAQS